METIGKLKCAVLGATGVAGQQFIIAADNHPWFEITGVYASERSAGRRYDMACVWHDSSSIPSGVRALEVRDVRRIEDDLESYDIIFSALGSENVKEIEGKCAAQKPVISTTSAFRMDQHVPIIIPEINARHLALIDAQRAKKGWKGFVLPGPNCTTVGLAVSLKPIQDEFGILRVSMVSMQAISGAGYPGVSALDITGNVIPFIRNEEEKVQRESVKILGEPKEDWIRDACFRISCTCTRVPVIDGHTEVVSVETEKPCDPELYKSAIRKFNERFRRRFGHLPSCPSESIVIKNEEDRPQPRKDRDVNGGMSVCIGRIRRAEMFQHGLSYVVLSHNTKKGAAKGGIFVAECLVDKGIVAMKR